MTAATEDLLAAQTRTVQAHTVQAQTVLTATVPACVAQTARPHRAWTAAGTVRTHRIFIRATPEEIWDALTRPGWTQLYGYRAPAQYEMRPGGAYRAFASVTMKMRGISGVVFDGEVIEAEPPWRLVQTWHVLFDARDPGRVGYPAELGDSGR